MTFKKFIQQGHVELIYIYKHKVSIEAKQHKIRKKQILLC